MGEYGYRVSELARQAGVSVRTVRYYINEGLLPSSDLRGRYALYDDEHLDRLQLILRLKEAFLPLKEIRSRLELLSISEIRQLLLETDPAGSQPMIDGLEAADEDPSEPAPPAEPGSARDYITRVLEAHAPHFTSEDRPQPASPAARPERAASATPRSRPADPAAEQGPRRVPLEHRAVSNQRMFSLWEEDQGSPSWQRIALSKGIELHVRGDLPPALRRKLEQLIDFAHDLFSE